MFTGRDALFTVEQAISRVRADEGRLDLALRSAMEDAARLRTDQARAFRALARVKLDAMLRDQVIGDLDATEQRARAMIEQHRREVDDLARRREAAQAALDQAEAAKHQRDEDLAKTLEALEDQRERTAERMKSDIAWQAAKAALNAAETVAANADEKAALAEADLAAKRKPYEDDPLFMYLWKKRHGEAVDKSGPFVRWLDRKVARLVGYQDARANFAMLQEIPKRLRDHADAKRREVEAAREALAEIERKALIADGIEALEADASAARDAMKAAEDAVVRATAALKQLDAEREKALGVGEGAAHAGALDLLAEALAREDLRQLYEEAVRTPGTADDQVIATLSKLDAALQKADGEVAAIRSQIRELARRRTELEEARDRARHVGYDDPRGTFSGEQILAEVIAGILRGVLRGSELDRVLRDSYRFPGPRGDPDFGHRGRAPPWPSPWGGPWGGGKSDDGDGWRTGGRF